MKHGFCKTARIIFFAILLTFLTFTAANAQNMLINGDAQDSSAAGAFASHAGSSVSIVDDPYDEKGENKCWYICPDDGLTSKVWSYFWQYGPVFEPGKSYLIEMDVAVGERFFGKCNKQLQRHKSQYAIRSRRLIGQKRPCFRSRTQYFRIRQVGSRFKNHHHCRRLRQFHDRRIRGIRQPYRRQ